jgi:hypothetical protein
MLTDFETGLDRLLAQYGVIVKKAAGELPDMYRQGIPDDARASKSVQPPAPLSSSSGVKKSDMPNGVGRAEEMSITPVSRAIGGDMKMAMAVVKSKAKAQALEKLGFRNPEHRHYAFGPTEALNVAKLLGFYETALKSKYASIQPELRKKKLASDPLLKELTKLANLGATTLGAVRDMVMSTLSHPLETAAAGVLLSPAIPKTLNAMGSFRYRPNDPALTRYNMAYSGNGRAGPLSF